MFRILYVLGVNRHHNWYSNTDSNCIEYVLIIFITVLNFHLGEHIELFVYQSVCLFFVPEHNSNS